MTNWKSTGENVLLEMEFNLMKVIKMKTLFLFSLVILISNKSLACLLPAGIYTCDNASFSEIGKENVIIKEVIVSNDGLSSTSIWNATGDVWVSDGNDSGHFEKQDFQYFFNLTTGIHFVEHETYTSAACEVNPAGVQVFWGSFLRLPNQNDFYVSRIRFTALSDTGGLNVWKDSENSFNCKISPKN